MPRAIVRASSSRIAPFSYTAHKRRGVQYFKPIPIETWKAETRHDAYTWADESILGELRRIIRARRLPYDPGSAADTWTRETGLLRCRRSWTDYATGDRWILEVEAEMLPSAVSIPARAFTERTVGHVAHRDEVYTRARIPHRVTMAGKRIVCSCGVAFEQHRQPDDRHRRLFEQAGIRRTIAPTFAQ
jgi:hypothetical protein